MREMKIALQVGAPEPDQLQAFMQAYAESDSVAAIGQAASSGNVIAAYDSGRLIGIGSRVQAPGQETLLKVVIAPGYERRGIRDHMVKLMLPRSERRAPAV
jgi:hypothetical protein